MKRSLHKQSQTIQSKPGRVRGRNPHMSILGHLALPFHSTVLVVLM